MYTLEKKHTKFSKKSSHIARRAWDILRLALLWARKGGLFKNRHRLIITLTKFTRKLMIHSGEPRGALVFGDHEFSFDETPMFRVKMHRPSSSLRFKLPRFSCVKPQVDFDYDEDFVYEDEDEVCCGNGGGHVQSTSLLDDDDDVDDVEEERRRVDNGDEGIDVKAEEFIAKFYQQMKLQRQISYLQHK